MKQGSFKLAGDSDSSRPVGMHGGKNTLHLVGSDTVCRKPYLETSSPLVFAGGLEAILFHGGFQNCPSL